MQNGFFKLATGALMLSVSTLGITAGAAASDHGSDKMGSDKMAMQHGKMYEDAVANANRPADHRTRDAGRKPAEVMEFIGIKPGMTVVDLYSGSGYYTWPLANLVGEGGKVIAHNGTRRLNEERRAAIVENLKPLSNVTPVFVDSGELDLADNSVDAAMLVLIYHHWHYREDEGEVLPEETKVRLNNIKRMLKPGGTFTIIEHRASDDTSREDSASTHRTSGAVIKADLTSQGFEFVGESDVLDFNKDDDMSVFWRNRVERDHTRRVLMTFRKP